MKKKLLLFFGIFSLVTAAQAQKFFLNNLNFEGIGNNEVKITESKNASGDLIIPSSVQYNNATYRVTKIEHNAFEGDLKLTSVTIPASINSIEWSVFNSCRNLTSVTDNSSCTDISDWTYTNCINLKTFKFASNLQKIGGHAFAGCNSLENLSFPSSLKEIGEYAFATINHLGAMKFGPNFYKIGYKAFEKTDIPSVEFTRGSVEIGSYAFSSSGGIKKVTFVGSGNVIGDHAFINSGISTVDVAKVSKIGDYAFEGCTALKSFDFSNTSLQMGIAPFYNSGLETVLNFNNLMLKNGGVIPANLFLGAKSLKNFDFGGNTKKIGDHAFKQSGLTSVTIPSNITEVGSWAFESCDNLQSVSLPATLSTVSDGTFYNCKNLKAVVMPASYSDIKFMAFNACSSLEGIYYLGNSAPNIGEYAFDGTSKNFGFYVKPSAYAAVSKMNRYAEKVRSNIPVTLTSSPMAFTPLFNANFASANGLEVYIVTGYKSAENKLDLAKVTDAAAGTGLLLKGNVGTTYNVQLADNATTYDNNLLVGAKEAQFLTNDFASSDAALTVKGTPTVELYTDKCAYKPGDQVYFTVAGSIPSGAKVRYLHGNKVVETATPSGNGWSWTVPNKDFTGYLAEVYTDNGGGNQNVIGAIGIDVSTDWGRFPRYGFVANYDRSKDDKTLQDDVDWMNRFHINGVQFYDWQYKHNKPYYDGSDQTYKDKFKSDQVYEDLFNRETSNDVIEGYISRFKAKGAKSMFYDLIYGAFDNEPTVKSEWGLYDWDDKSKSYYHKKYELRSSGAKSDIMLQNPGNEKWQEYMVNAIKDCYEKLKFDGFHIDQLGGSLGLDYQHNAINGFGGYASFINKMASSYPNKYLVMNSVANDGRQDIVGTGKMAFGYNEVWYGTDEEFNEFYRIIKGNRAESGNDKLATVFAAYMHKQTVDYDQTNVTENNQPGILMADAAIFALGGSHLEIGDQHLLEGPYFADKKRTTSEDLKSALRRYYDFLVAYENYLRDGGTEVELQLSGTNINYHPWGMEGPKIGTVTTFSKVKDNLSIIQMLNFNQALSTQWRDRHANTPEPFYIDYVPVTMSDAKPVSKIWVATPDDRGGVPQEISFNQDKNTGKLSFTVPGLKYWTMVVIEHSPSSLDPAADGKNTYVLKNGQFVAADDAEVGAGDMYLRLSSSEASNLNDAVKINFDSVTGIDNITEENKTKSSNDYYSVAGIKTNKPVKGIYIHDGKKIIVK